MASEPIPLSGLARRLVDDGIINAETASRATNDARKAAVPFVTYIVRNGLADARAVARSASDEFGVPLLDLAAFDLEAIPKTLVKERLIRQHNTLPLIRRGARLFVAVSDPTNLQALDEIKFQTGVTTEPVLVEEDKLAIIIEQFLNAREDNSLSKLEGEEFDEADMQSMSDDGPDSDEDAGNATDDTPIVRFVNKMLLDAIRIGASDIHFETYEKTYRVRFRTDGILKEIAKPPSNLSHRLAARLKVMAELDISERRMSQDGRIKMKLSKTKAIDFWVNTLPTLWGEKIVLRILDPTSAKMGVDALGFETYQGELFMEALQRPGGSKQGYDWSLTSLSTRLATSTPN